MTGWLRSQLRRVLLWLALRVVLGSVVGLYWYVKFLPNLRHRVLWQEGVTIGPFLLAVYLFSLAKPTARTALTLILGVGLALQIIAMSTPPNSSDDDYRYVWDAKVQLSGIDPYRYAPAAPELRNLRTPFFFPDRMRCPWPVDDGTACSAINRPNVRTVYPPVAEAAFDTVRILSFGDRGGHLPIQLTAGLGAVVVAWLLARRALGRRSPLWPVALWAWCPLVATEFGNNAHIDWLGVLFCVLALSSEATLRSGLAGLFVGAAIATKIYPGLVIVSLLRRRPVVVIASAVVLVAASYLPHVLAIGPDVLGYLPGYLRDEQYTTGGRFLLLDPWLPDSVTTVAAALGLATTAVWVFRQTDVDVPERTAVVTAGVVLLVATPSYGWYALLLLALIAMSGAVEWLPVAIVPSFFYLIQSDFHTGPAFGSEIYGGAAVATLAWFAARQRLSIESKNVL